MGFERRNHKFKIINLKLYMANILITGANGQLGTELRNRSFSLLDDVFYTDVEELDITNFKAICAFIETHDIDTIINCAAYTAVDQAEDDEEKAMKLNRDAVANLANAAVNWIVCWSISRQITCLTGHRIILTRKKMLQIRRACMEEQNWKENRPSKNRDVCILLSVRLGCTPGMDIIS